ncbi:tRNA (N(6)-L-threonylcarbamoyladenosine(37)-C(2))-methylthiotransferase MtaB [Selenomonas sp. TAMA-11512]|uniref:tRNA (N(6)-L-threonylcarbamoyladenosine(37)-C(2))- methylthiotransferase MtaB n=1 Tax=Selenomonas sp. TAMA-11512 TaxID=3095337 RepID=UPI00308F39B7|nr:tRNA (N(6)-L-threonylcarbamoyladenosine(37)-C(2))-methylthiotransferase MtaB [Selenomonas sp. TAMA-11512]
MRTAALTTLGCKVNQVETEMMEGLFKARGYTIVPFEEAADVYVINTCSVTHLGEKKSRQLVRRAKRTNESAVIAVTGCYAQVAPEEIRAIEGVRVVIGTKDRGKIVDFVETAVTTDGVLDETGDIMHAEVFEDIPLLAAPGRTRAFLKIEEGCNNFCTFCIIPYARGPVRSRALSSIKSEAEKLVEHGFREIVLTGIHLGHYGEDLSPRLTLADAAQAVLDIPGLTRLRLGSLESIELDDRLLELWARDPRFAGHLHLPLQAGTDAILKRMNRKYTREDFARLFHRLEGMVPDAAISTDVIVGFPGETDELFEEGLAFIERLPFARMHVFPYSKRTGTPAAKMDGQVPEEVKKERAARMQAIADRKREDFAKKFIGRTMDILLETEHEGEWNGITENYIKVYVIPKEGKKLANGSLVSVHLQGVYKDGLRGTRI